MLDAAYTLVLPDGGKATYEGGGVSRRIVADGSSEIWWLR